MLSRTSPMTAILPDRKTCPVCKQVFVPQRPLAQVCSPLCAKRKVAAAKKADRATTRARREAIKTRSEWMKEAQAEVNRYVRLRDAHLPCVSCGRFHEGQWHAGHFRSVGSSPELRFDLSNLNRQCAPCNVHLSGNLIPYRAELVRRIGQAEVDRLEGPQTPRKYTIADLKAMRDLYRGKCRELEEMQ